MQGMIKLPYGTKRASKETINALIAIGALLVDKNGIHTNEPGIYPKKRRYPCK